MNIQETIMGKAHESAKAVKKPAVMSLKDKRAARRAKKPVPSSPPFMGHHYQ